MTREELFAAEIRPEPGWHLEGRLYYYIGADETAVRQKIDGSARFDLKTLKNIGFPELERRMSQCKSDRERLDEAVDHVLRMGIPAWFLFGEASGLGVTIETISPQLKFF